MADGDLLDDVWVLGTIEGVPPIPSLPLYDVPSAYEMDLMESAIFQNRFPTPPSAWGFLTDDPDEMMTYSAIPPTTLVGLYTAGALAPGSDILEPTHGQIWPR